MVFKIADDNGLLLLDMKDLRAMCQDVGDNAKEFTTEYGNISAASIGAIQRGLMQIESQGGDAVLWRAHAQHCRLHADRRECGQGKGVVNILAADKLMNAPRLYATFLLWMLSELFEHLPEVGDLDKPKMVFFFDEAHLLFNDAPRCCWSASNWWCAWCAARAWACILSRKTRWTFPTPCWRNWATACSTRCAPLRRATRRRSRPPPKPCGKKPGLDIETAITELAVGEALVSLLDDKGRPSVTERVYVLPPGSQIGPITPEQRQALLHRLAGGGRVRAGAGPRIGLRAAHRPGGRRATSTRRDQCKHQHHRHHLRQRHGHWCPKRCHQHGRRRWRGTRWRQRIMDGIKDTLFGRTGPRGGQHDGLAQTLLKSTVRTMGSAVGREIIRGVLGSMLGGRRR
jgi:hypothetical protein